MSRSSATRTRSASALPSTGVSLPLAGEIVGWDSPKASASSARTRLLRLSAVHYCRKECAHPIVSKKRAVPRAPTHHNARPWAEWTGWWAMLSRSSPMDAGLPDRQPGLAGPDAIGDGERVTDDIAAESSVSDVSWPADGYVGEPAVQAEWDRRYADQAQL